MKQIVNISEVQSDNMKDELIITGDSIPRLKGEVTICEKLADGRLQKIREKCNLIVFGGREWLLRRAFGTVIEGNEADIYDKVIKWFAIGNGGGEPGNPLQAGTTYGSDSALLQPVRMRSDLQSGDPGFTLYASDYNGDHGYYKSFSSAVIKEDHSNPYVVNEITNYPALIAEVRIELSSDDANGGSYEDLNEAGLFVSDPSATDPGEDSASGGNDLGNIDVIRVTKDNDFAIYVLDSTDLSTDIPGLNNGDTIWVATTGNPNNAILEISPRLIIDTYNGETGKNAYIVVEKPNAENEDPIGAGVCVATFTNKLITPYIMFSRVTFSTIRKTVDREIVFLWKIYF